MNAEHQIADPGPRRSPGTPAWLRGSNATILCALWVAVIVLAVAIDIAK